MRHYSWQQPGDKESNQLHYGMTGDHVYDIRRYGAVSNPVFVTENTAAIQLAIETANLRGGGTVFVPQGIYYHTGINMRSNVHLVGEGWKSILYLADDSDRNSIDCDAITDVIIRDLMVNNNRDNQDDAVMTAGVLPWDCITIIDSNGDGTGTPCERIIVDNVYAYKGSAHGIRVEGSTDIIVTNCRCEDAGDDGIGIERGSSLVLIEGNICYNNLSPSAVSTAGAGIETEEAVSDITIINNLIDVCNCGISFGMASGTASGHRVIINDNQIRDCGRGIVAIGDIDAQGELIYDLLIQGNIISDTILKAGFNPVGIHVAACEDVIITDNIIRNIGTNAHAISLTIPVDNPITRKINISNNHITTVVRRGVDIAAGCEDIVVEGNSIVSAGEEGIQALGSVGISISNNFIDLCDNAGIAIHTSTEILICANTCRNNSLGGAGVNPGILINNVVDGFRVYGNRCYDDQGAKTQSYGIQIGNNCLNGSVTGNDVRGNLTAPIFDDGTTTVTEIHSNIGYDGPGMSLRQCIRGFNTTGLTIAVGLTRYLGENGTIGAAATASYGIVPNDGIFRRLFAHTDIAAGAGESFIYALYVNGAATALTCTIDGAAETDDEDIVNEVAVVAGDQYCIQLITSGAAGAAVHWGGYQLEIDSELA